MLALHRASKESKGPKFYYRRETGKASKKKKSNVSWGQDPKQKKGEESESTNNRSDARQQYRINPKGKTTRTNFTSGGKAVSNVCKEEARRGEFVPKKGKWIVGESAKDSISGGGADVV